MTVKTTRFFITKRNVTKGIIEGYRKTIYFQMGDVQYFNCYKYSDGLLDVNFYNGNRILIEHSEQDFLINYEKSRLSNYTNLN